MARTHPYVWEVTYASEKAGGLAPKGSDYTLRWVFPESSQHQTPAAILHEIRKACASPNRRSGAGVFVKRTDRVTGETIEQVRYRCSGNKPLRTHKRERKRR